MVKYLHLFFAIKIHTRFTCPLPSHWVLRLRTVFFPKVQLSWLVWHKGNKQDKNLVEIFQRDSHLLTCVVPWLSSCPSWWFWELPGRTHTFSSQQGERGSADDPALMSEKNYVWLELLENMTWHLVMESLCFWSGKGIEDLRPSASHPAAFSPPIWHFKNNFNVTLA